MSTRDKDKPIRVVFYDSAAKADEAVGRLLAAGISKEELAVICPDHLKGEFTSSVPTAEHPGSNAPQAIIAGGAAGAAAGGIALTATVLATGGLGVLALPVLVGGGAIAGGFSALLMADGYGKEIGEHYEEAIRLGKIVVGVKAAGEDSASRLAKADAIFAETGGTSRQVLKEHAH